MRIIDAHCHVDLMPSMESFVAEAINRQLGLLAVTTVPKAYEIECFRLRNYDNIRIALGLHPQLIAERYSELDIFERNVKTAKYVGEIGLDFGSQFYFSKELQQAAFEKILLWCTKYSGKVLSIHTVHSDKYVLDAIERFNVIRSGNKCILHWYSGSASQLQRAINLGCHFSVNNYMVNTFKSREHIKRIPPSQLLLETDAPFLNNVKSTSKVFASLLSTEQALNELYGYSVSRIIQNTSCRMFDFGN